MKDWTDMFKEDQELGIMYDAYYRLRQTNPTLQAPSAPQKQGLTATDRQKEDDELQMALKLSLQEEERKKAGPSSSGGAQASGSGQQQQEEAPAPPPAGTTAATVSRVRALYDFTPLGARRIGVQAWRRHSCSGERVQGLVAWIAQGQDRHLSPQLR